MTRNPAATLVGVVLSDVGSISQVLSVAFPVIGHRWERAIPVALMVIIWTAGETPAVQEEHERHSRRRLLRLEWRTRGGHTSISLTMRFSRAASG